MDRSQIYPRLRLRRNSRRKMMHVYDTPGAGPSRLSSDHLGYDIHDDEDDQPTPRLSTAAKLSSEKTSPLSSNDPALPSGDPPAVLRLRSVMARARETPRPSSLVNVPGSPSDVASDLESVHPSTTGNSIASQSLHDLFSRALSETPKKPWTRRNSIDASEVEDSPRLERVHWERAYNRGKRRSMSDEEAEKTAVLPPKSDTPRFSSAAKFDALRQRLEQSTTRPPPTFESQSEDENPLKISGNTDTIAKRFNASTAEPLAESTPARSLAMPSHMQMHSNLLDQDSEMQRAMNGVESSETESVPKELPNNSQRAPGRRRAGPPPARPLSWTSHSKSHDHHKLPLVRRTSEEIESSSSRRSSLPSSSNPELHGKERNWNRPNGKYPVQFPGTPERSRHRPSNSSPISALGSGSPGQSEKSRRLSVASPQSLDDGNHSRSSSMSSKSEYRERQRELEEERNKIREQQWNKPQPRLRTLSSVSSASPTDRTRTYSQPTRPESATSYLGRPGMSRHSSQNSFSGSSRTESPSSSGASRDFDKERLQDVTLEVKKEREYNWNSPMPKWFHQKPPVGEPPSASTVNGLQPQMNAGPWKNAIMDESFPGQVDTSNGSMAPPSEAPERSTSSPSRTINGTSRLPRFTSARHDDVGSKDLDASATPRFAFPFPRHRVSLPPFELDFKNPDGPPSRSSSRLSMTSQEGEYPKSRIPVWSPNTKKTQTSPKSKSERKEPSYKRNFIEDHEPLIAMPPPILAQSEPESEPEPESQPRWPPPRFSAQDEIRESDQEPISSTSTPIPRAAEIRTSIPPASPPRQQVTHIPHIPATQDTFLRETARPDSPPPTPPSPARPDDSLQTPPRRSFHSASHDFETPSPPRFLPDLPGPPPDSDDEASDKDHRTPLRVNSNRLADFTMNKTPRPPGAWITTPVSQIEREMMTRPSSTPPERVASLFDSTDLAKRPATMSKANTPAAQTPAPPGAWIATPVPTAARRKSILKVRFDVETGNTSSDGFPEVPVTGPQGQQQPYADSDTNPLLDTPPQRQSNGSAKSHMKLALESSIDEDSPSPSVSRLLKPKSPIVRVLDAYGREVTTHNAPQPIKEEDEKENKVRDDVKPKRVKKEEGEGKLSTSRNRSTIRIVDAMGREVQEAPPPETTDSTEDEPSTPLSHNEALARVRRTISHLAHDLDEVDKSCDELAHDENRIGALQDASKAARNARKRISESLQLVQTAEDDLRNKFGSLRNGMGKSKLLPSLEGVRAHSRSCLNTWTISLFVLIQAILLIAMYRHSVVRARKLFLTTYYDPFNPDIFLHITHPENVRPSISHSFFWSPASIPDALSREGWKGVASEMWGNVTCIVVDLQDRLWEAWSSRRDQTISWPPT